MYRSRDYDIKIALPLILELRQMYRYRYKCNPVEKPPTHWKTGEKNRKINENILAL